MVRTRLEPPEMPGSPRTVTGDEPPSDFALIDRANAGDPAAFEDLYLRHRDWVARLAFRWTGDHSLSLDVVQEVFLYWLGKFPGFRLTARVQTFLYPAVRNVAISALRRRGRSAPDSEAVLASMIAPEAMPAGWCSEEWLEALAHLSVAHREVLLMRFVDELALGEIASELGLPLGTVKSRLHHALADLRNDPRLRKFLAD